MEMIKHNRLAATIGGIVAFYLLTQAFLLAPIPSVSTIFRKPVVNACSSPKFQWRGANEKIYPQSGRPIHIRHNDYTKGLVTFDTSVFMARSLNEEFSVEVEIFTSLDLPQEDFEITYNRDEYIINSMIPQNSDFITAEETKNEGHCVVMKVHLMIPVSKPLTGLKFEFPKANVYFHETLWGSVPYLDIDVTSGAVIMAPDQRLHVESISIKLDSGKILGKVMLTKSLQVHLRQGTLDLDIGYSPYLIGASIDVSQQSGLQKIKLQDLFYRPTTGTYELQEGAFELTYPGSYHGSLSLDSKQGSVELLGDSISIREQSPAGVKPAFIEADHGNSRTGVSTNVRHGTGSVVVKVEKPTRLQGAGDGPERLTIG